MRQNGADQNLINTFFCITIRTGRVGGAYGNTQSQNASADKFWTEHPFGGYGEISYEVTTEYGSTSQSYGFTMAFMNTQPNIVKNNLNLIASSQTAHALSSHLAETLLCAFFANTCQRTMARG